MIHSKRETISKDLVASWTVHVGDMDQVLHLWRYTGGFAKIDKAEALLNDDAVSIYRALFKLNPSGQTEPPHFPSTGLSVIEK